jgi:hypothetical protein
LYVELSIANGTAGGYVSFKLGVSVTLVTQATSYWQPPNSSGSALHPTIRIRVPAGWYWSISLPTGITVTTAYYIAAA